jgi:O-antigen ligase/tetratricopeptide (TPR) repeat protein
MADKVAKALKKARGITAEAFAHKAVVWWLPILYCLISSLFYLRTYDSAQVKISIMQMGGLVLLAIWAVRLVELGCKAFNKEDLITLSPFLAYLAVGIFSFLHAPYNMASVDFFLRHCFFMIVALIMIYEFESEAVDRLTKVLIFTAWIAVGYGFLQYVDNTWFPRGVGKGIDPFIWRGAFGLRVFSTYGNPNFFADFLVIVFPILLTQYLKTRRWTLLPLMGLLLVDLIMTGTKGAWVGFAMVVFFFGVIAFIYFKEVVAPYRAKILGALSAIILTFVLIVARDLSTRMVSVNFRLFTWEATWEMIRSQPIIGTGIGSFPPVYPAFRRPPIFHIEGKHNTETDHAENEYLEQLLDNGILGFGIFLWLVFSTLVVGFRTLGQLTTTLSQKDGRAPPRAYDLIGYMVALMGMLGHNLFDVSMRFVSSGVYLGLLSGTIVNLARGKALYELHTLRAVDPAIGGREEDEGPSLWRTISEFLIWPARLAAWAGLAYMGFLLLRDFNFLQGSVGRLTYGGEVLQWWVAWAALLGCVLCLGGILMRLVSLSESPLAPAVVLAMLYPLHLFWGYFKADVHHNIAIYFSKERNWDQALGNYFIVNKLNPNFVMSLYFTGNVFNDRFNMDKVYNPNWGDKDSVARDDYERAMMSYDEVRKLSPNYVQMHHQVGSLHMKRAEWAMNHGQPQEAQAYLEKALNRFKLYQAIDPVFPPNYYRMGQVYMILKRYGEAAKAYEDLINAGQCVVSPKLLATPWLRNSILSYQGYVDTPGEGVSHKHESAEAYAGLANAYYMMEEWERAEKAYLRALTLEPNFDNAKKNLSVLYQKVQSLGRLRPVARLPAGAAPGPFTGYEIVPAR